MGAYTRIPADTFQQIQTDAGILLYAFDPANPKNIKDEDIICPTTGGVTAACVPTYSDMGEDVDNCPANLLELKHLDSYDCSLQFTSLGTTPKSIRLALGAATGTFARAISLRAKSSAGIRTATVFRPPVVP